MPDAPPGKSQTTLTLTQVDPVIILGVVSTLLLFLRLMLTWGLVSAPRYSTSTMVSGARQSPLLYWCYNYTTHARLFTLPSLFYYIGEVYCHSAE